MKQMLHRALAAVTALCLAACLLPAAWAAESGPAAGAAPVTLKAYLQARQTLEEAGYSPEEVETLYASLTPETLVGLTARPYCPRLAEYAALPYFREEDLERCIAYGQAHPELDAQDVVTYVNIGLDRQTYTEIITVEQPDQVDVLVNKYRTLGSGYTPELVRMGSAYTTRGADYLQLEAYEWFVRMADAAREEGLRLRSVSAYRSYATQRSLFNSYAARSGVAAAETYSARPGHSEHQTGLALDINAASTSSHFERTAEYRWLIEHCWEYGFILRYPQGKSAVTGYIYEPWHYRYVGVELAGQIRDSGLTYDEFVARQSVRELPAPAPAVTLDGQVLELSAAVLYDQLYLPAGALLQALGWSSQWEGDRLMVSAPAWETVLDPQVLGGTLVQGDLYLSAPVLAQALGLGLWQTEGTLLLSSTPAEEGWPFVDVLPYDPCYEAVRFVWSRGLFSGVSEDRFGPDRAMTRGMVATVLAKLDPESALQEGEQPPFSDVEEESWYSSGAAWAWRTGLMDADSDGRFRPDEAMTWEQAADVLLGFARYTGDSSASGWEGDALEWAAQRGLLSTEGAETDPQRSLTRAELALALEQLWLSGEQPPEEMPETVPEVEPAEALPETEAPVQA